MTHFSRTRLQHAPPLPPVGAVDQGPLPQAGVPSPPGLRQPVRIFLGVDIKLIPEPEKQKSTTK